VFLKNDTEPTFYVANRAHHSDVGGMSPGSMPLSRSIYQEGIRIPPVRLIKEGTLDSDLMALLLANVRTPTEREGDLTAQVASNRTGARRLRAIAEKYGAEMVVDYMHHLQAYAERMTREAIKAIADGSYTFEDCMDDDGQGNGPLPIVVTLTIRDDEARIDFTGSAPQVEGSVNAIYAITLSAVMYCFRVIVPFAIPSNYGTIQPLEVVVPEGSLLNARLPAAVAGGNVETSQRIVDAVLGAMSWAIPDRIPAASSGTMNNLTLGGTDPRTNTAFAYYETIAGGMGARPGAAGLDATHTHMTNSLNTPIEALEHAYPFLMRRYEIRRGSGGAGRFRGGDGIRREIEILCPGQITILSDRRVYPPYGLAGGSPGGTGRNVLTEDGVACEIPSKASIWVKAHSIISVRTPGGGGFGKDQRRPPADESEDVEQRDATPQSK
jgi:N-methylhydantoinase B